MQEACLEVDLGWTPLFGFPRTLNSARQGILCPLNSGGTAVPAEARPSGAGLEDVWCLLLGCSGWCSLGSSGPPPVGRLRGWTLVWGARLSSGPRRWEGPGFLAFSGGERLLHPTETTLTGLPQRHHGADREDGWFLRNQMKH